MKQILDLLKGHRTWVMGVVIAWMCTRAITQLPPEFFVQAAPHLKDILYALAVLIGVGKIGDVLLLRQQRNRDKAA